MKKLILMLMVAGLFSVTPVLAAVHEMKSDGVQSAGDHVQRCVLQNEAIGEKIQRLQGEIAKGETKYTAEELRQLEEKLKEVNFMLDSISEP